MKTDQDQLVILANGAEAVRPPVAASVVESNGGNEGCMPLASSYDTLVPWREDCNQVILPTSLQGLFSGLTYRNTICDSSR